MASTAKASAAFCLLILLFSASDVRMKVHAQLICEVKGPIYFGCSTNCSQYCYSTRRCGRFGGTTCTGYRCAYIGFLDPRSQCYCRWRC